MVEVPEVPPVVLEGVVSVEGVAVMIDSSTVGGCTLLLSFLGSPTLTLRPNSGFTLPEAESRLLRSASNGFDCAAHSLIGRRSTLNVSLTGP